MARFVPTTNERTMNELKIRPATPTDVPVLFELIQALAEYEKLSHLVTGTVDALHDHLFGAKPYVEAILAEYEGAELLWGAPVDFRFAVVGSDPPHVSYIVQVSQESLRDYRWEYNALLGSLRECYETGDWREPFEKVIQEF